MIEKEDKVNILMVKISFLSEKYNLTKLLFM